MDVDLGSLRAWIGRTAEAEDVVTRRLAAEFRATFGPHLAATAVDETPPAFHWCLSPAIVPEEETGPDGHPRRGGFLPPVPLPRRMWAGGEVEIRAPLRVGDTVLRQSRIEDVSLKDGRSGPLCFVAVRHDYSTGRGLAVSERHDIVYREAEPARASGAPAARPPGPAETRTSDLAWTVEATPLLLFRYSALTFNGHRIHYDLPYVTVEEGYAGLVVHGPIQATLLLNLVSVLGGGAPARFAYRGLSPLIAGAPFTVAGERGPDGGLRCWTQSAEGRICMEATASA